MNAILEIRRNFQERKNPNKPGPRNIPTNASSITTQHMRHLKKQLEDVQKFWESNQYLSSALIDVEYRTVIPKSSRINGFFSGNGPINKTVVGARFAGEGTDKRHVITHYVGMGKLKQTIERLSGCIHLIETVFGGTMSHNTIATLNEDTRYGEYGLSKSAFRNITVDSYYVKNFTVPDNSENTDERSIVTIYKTESDPVSLMSLLGITIHRTRLIGDTSMLLMPDEISILKAKAPYLIAMAVQDLNEISTDEVASNSTESITLSIPTPKDEPAIGVIDTMFDENVYFSEWVDFHNMLDDNIELDRSDYDHGTSVSSIIVDGPSFNPSLDDGCGRFKVRHFGVARGTQFNSFTIMKMIEQIIIENRDIKVWNLSLGSTKEVNLNFISPEASVLDELQYKYDVIFVVAGTNKNPGEENAYRVGAPADSINSLVVNSVSHEGKPASYTRYGTVLSFFNKPDVSSFGGDRPKYIRVCTPTGEGLRAGTSFAAPWVARKVAYLIEILGMSREVAKALIVDAASGWGGKANDLTLAPLIGHGKVPVHIDSIIKTEDDEIRFIVSGKSEQWETYSYNLPVPVYNNEHPFVARATLCYFPRCSVNQGVDYTNTEFDFYFGRVKDGGIKAIKAINGNVQQVNDGVKHYVDEGTARKFYRKWDNTKHIQEKNTGRTRLAYGDGLWGIKLNTTERLNSRDGEGIKFGIVATLKEVKGKNRIDDFIRLCEMRGWIVNRIDVETRVDIYGASQETITFE